MNNDEAIKIIKVAKAEVEWDYPLDYQIAFDVAIEALEYRNPKEPAPLKMVNRDDYGYCPTCDGFISREDKFCRKCGQHLTWENV